MEDCEREKDRKQARKTEEKNMGEKVLKYKYLAARSPNRGVLEQQ
jgi:hypothetical protein